MKPNHLLESEIQQYSLDRLHCDKQIIAHIQSCESCREMAETYGLIFTTIKDQKEPSFDFDLTEMVMQQLPGEKVGEIADKPLIVMISVIAVIAIGSAVFFFGSYFKALMATIAPMLIYLVITTAASLMLFMGIDLFSEYHKKMKILKYY